MAGDAPANNTQATKQITRTAKLVTVTPPIKNYWDSRSWDPAGPDFWHAKSELEDLDPIKSVPERNTVRRAKKPSTSKH